MQTLLEVIRGRELSTRFQPIVALDGGTVVAYEALTRGPEGSVWESPDALFAAAREQDLIAELDEACRDTALTSARKAGLTAPGSVFVNSEPECLALFAGSVGADSTPMVVEITERALTGDPAALLRAVRSVRESGWLIALDDVGADPASLAMLPLVAPDIIKLDMQLVRTLPNQHSASIMSAVTAHAEATGATILAEGIETDRQLVTAEAMGATFGQGWLFGRPGVLDVAESETIGMAAHLKPSDRVPEAGTPFELAARHSAPRRSHRRLLLEISKFLEAKASLSSDAAILLSTFQHADNVGAGTLRRYDDLVDRLGLVGVLANDLLPGLFRGRVHVGGIDASDPLVDEWDVVVLTPDFAAMLVASTHPGDPSGGEFDFVLTHDRQLVIDAALSLVTRL
jgi:EAL domain-containing protein (putative c-di-GMP-specific phosphodiesterase class I)